MRNLSLILLFLAFAGSLSAQSKSKTVLTAYQELEKFDKATFGEYPLKKNADSPSGWATTSSADYDLNVYVVDTKNGYIEIKDEGTGGGVLRTQVVLYRKADGGELIVFNQQVFDGDAVSTEVLKFYETKGGKWANVKTSDVLPSVKASDFYKATPPSQIASEMEVLYEFPRTGTTAKAQLNTRVIELMCAQNETAPEFGDGCDWLSSNKKTRESIDLVWDKAKRKFSLGAKK